MRNKSTPNYRFANWLGLIIIPVLFNMVLYAHDYGRVTERLKVQHWKCCVRFSVPWVRIPPRPLEKGVDLFRAFLYLPVSILKCHCHAR